MEAASTTSSHEKTYLQIAMNNAPVMEMLHGRENLPDDTRGVLLRVGLQLNDAVKQLATSNAEET